MVRAAHNRSLDSDSERLWSKLEAQPISFEQEIELPQTSQRTARQTKLAIRFCPVNLRTPYRFDNRDRLLERLNGKSQIINTSIHPSSLFWFKIG
ncbi:MAG: hypothetical protein V7K85_29850 [Nostoc sp.]